VLSFRVAEGRADVERGEAEVWALIKQRLDRGAGLAQGRDRRFLFCQRNLVGDYLFCWLEDFLCVVNGAPSPKESLSLPPSTVRAVRSAAVFFRRWL